MVLIEGGIGVDSAGELVSEEQYSAFAINLSITLVVLEAHKDKIF